LQRQPLPSTFAARFIQGGTSEFATNLKIWREGTVGAGASCAATANNNQWISISELTRFDEHENPYTFCTYFFCEPPGLVPALAATSSTNTVDSTYPYMAGTDVGGWMYLNLNDGGSTSYSVTNHASGIASSAPTVFGNPRASQNWVTVTMFGKSSGSRMTAELDAAPLANGCTPSITPAGIGPYPPIGPAGGVFVCPPGTTLTNGTTALCTGTNSNPNQ